ncbi:hypothetical protein SRHO_G00238810 [Serrasalmus rhombeus]
MGSVTSALARTRPALLKVKVGSEPQSERRDRERDEHEQEKKEKEPERRKAQREPSAETAMRNSSSGVASLLSALCRRTSH